MSTRRNSRRKKKQKRNQNKMISFSHGYFWRCTCTSVSRRPCCVYIIVHAVHKTKKPVYHISVYRCSRVIGYIPPLLLMLPMTHKTFCFVSFCYVIFKLLPYRRRGIVSVDTSAPPFTCFFFFFFLFLCLCRRRWSIYLLLVLASPLSSSAVSQEFWRAFLRV